MPLYIEKSDIVSRDLRIILSFLVATNVNALFKSSTVLFVWGVGTSLSINDS